MGPRLWTVAASLGLGLSCPAAAQQSLDQAASDPTASLMSFQLQGYYTPNLHNADGSASLLQFRAAIPFEIGGLQQHRPCDAALCHPQRLG